MYPKYEVQLLRNVVDDELMDRIEESLWPEKKKKDACLALRHGPLRIPMLKRRWRVS
jgi:hypothetical protein